MTGPTQPGSSPDERCSCGNGICSFYEMHGWLCDECADALVDNHGQLETDDEREVWDDQ